MESYHQGTGYPEDNPRKLDSKYNVTVDPEDLYSEIKKHFDSHNSIIRFLKAYFKGDI